jgi:hypothetical protein
MMVVNMIVLIARSLEALGNKGSFLVIHSGFTDWQMIRPSDAVCKRKKGVSTNESDESLPFSTCDYLALHLDLIMQ